MSEETKIADLAMKVHPDGKRIDIYATEPGGDIYSITLEGPLPIRAVIEASTHYRMWPKISASHPGYVDAQQQLALAQREEEGGKLH